NDVVDHASNPYFYNSRNNVIGIILALLSSGFIGASFIIKKKGLRRAAAVSGVGGYSYLLERLWWIGMITMIVGVIANFVAYAFAPAVLVTLLGALSIIVSAVLAHIILKEGLHQLGIMGCVMCIAGSVVIVIHAPQEHAISSVKEIWYMATQKAFMLYIRSVVVLVFILVFYFAPQCGHSNVLVYTGICSLMGSLSVMSVKALGTSPKLTSEGKNQLIYSETWFFICVVAICVITQMNCLNKDWDDQNVGSIISGICGFIIVLSGTVLLHTSKELERSSSCKGNYTPLSPTLSTRLCSTNGVVLKHEEEVEPCSEEVGARRSELHA
ncbi:probable magnesium transporter NIPA3, partial [Lycium barbarum]|uniref:probable magnesium transporter NIPA3 n=1 Tax=Lycium barbarum TaxID=112863 RepID=UPI00293F7334